MQFSPLAKNNSSVEYQRYYAVFLVESTFLSTLHFHSLTCLLNHLHIDPCSGAPLFEASTAALADMYALTGGRIPLIGAGGVATGEQAYAKIRAGASLVQLYSALAYEGPPLVPRVKRELAQCLARDGFASVADAVGAAHRTSAPAKKASAAGGL